ncbi:hypothetical protein PVAND_015715 [Polypedilum vanderplanki]|uniref:WAP domain-containing protein n=1 Tax=Polypedilum vanderplanki TaxID=319348 RepID=A0A9J6BCY7_POLVA|nr:hypothetical protein PVAND_015715 [Polypedilum vanderplanki]
MKFTTTILIFATFIALTLALAPECPSYSQVSTCTPKCKEDIECASTGGKCCPNICNTKSCVSRQNNSKYGTNTGDKYGSNTATGSYCGNTKCNSFEKCGTDPSTKRPKCVRS